MPLSTNMYVCNVGQVQGPVLHNYIDNETVFENIKMMTNDIKAKQDKIDGSTSHVS